MNDTLYRDGAIACQQVMRELKPMLQGNSGQTFSQYFAIQDEALVRILEAAGPIPCRAAGVIALLAEYIIRSEVDGAIYEAGSLENPEATMSADDIQRSRQAFEDFARQEQMRWEERQRSDVIAPR